MPGAHGLRRSTALRGLALWALAALVAASCSSSPSSPGDARPSVIATTGIWADIVDNVSCDGLADVTTLIPNGADPHGFEPSLADRAAMDEAELVVANGVGLEASLDDTLAAVADGHTPVFRAGDQGPDPATTRGTGGLDPHIWMDPTRISSLLPELGAVLVAELGLDAEDVQACVAQYQEQLQTVDEEIERRVANLMATDRGLVTSHDSLGYFADRYGFRVIGTVIPSVSSLAETGPAQLEELARIVEEAGVKAIFTDRDQGIDDAEALADRLGDVSVVALVTSGLGPAAEGTDTYVGLLQTTADVIVDAIG